MHISAIIPARYGSQRFPGKLLVSLAGRPLIEWVYEAVKGCPLIERVIIATDSEQIYQAAQAMGAEVQLTSPNHPSGTDRIAEVAARIETDLVVNLQGDEPFMTAELISLAIEPLLQDQSLVMATLKTPIRQEEELFDPNIVKVVTDLQDFALYFSRAPIPYFRDEGPDLSSLRIFRHIGLYVYRKDFLLRLVRLTPSFLEEAEKLEQLRVLENGYKIKVIGCDYEGIGIDTPEDLRKAEELWQKKGR